MNEIDLWDYLKTLLLNNISSAKPASGGKEVVMICNNPDCNDKTGHLYIGMRNGIPMYHCKKCPNSGRVTIGFLNSIGIYDNDVNLELHKIKSNSKLITYKTNKKNLYVLRNSFISNTKLSEVKLKYINKRLGTNLSYNDLLQLKIVLNLYDVLDDNNIKKYTRYPNVMDELNNSFIGFISSNNASINMRNLREGKVIKYVDKRYVNYIIFENNDDPISSYVIPSTINLNLYERTRINIAEGPFDILSVYLNILKGQPGVYKALQGNNYLSLVDYILSDLKMFYSEVHIYRDLGVDYEEFIQVSQILKIFNIPVYLHTNASIGEKDFGVSPDKISEQIIQL